MYQESLKDEATRRNITAYQVKKERINAKLIWLNNRVKELEQQNTILKDANSQLFQDNNDLTDENNLLKLEQFNTTIAYNGSVVISTATLIYDDSIPDILNDTRNVISPDKSEHNVSTQAQCLDHYDDSIPENFVRLVYS
jgi:hypothetical protein